MPETAKLVEVAEVELALTVTKLVMVEVALLPPLTMMNYIHLLFGN